MLILSTLVTSRHWKSIHNTSMESDKITFEEVKAIALEEIDNAKNLNDLLEKIVQRIYQEGKNS